MVEKSSVYIVAGMECPNFALLQTGGEVPNPQGEKSSKCYVGVKDKRLICSYVINIRL